MALDIKDLIKQALTNQEAWEALTDFLLENGQIKPPEMEEWHDPEKFKYHASDKVKADVTEWVMNKISPLFVKYSNLKAGDIVAIRSVYGFNFHTVKKVERVDEFPEGYTPPRDMSNNDPWFDQYHMYVVDFVGGSFIKGPADGDIAVYRF